jgi:hypothetical protein
MDSELYYWGIFFLSLPIATYILTVYRTQARVAQEAMNGLQDHMFAVEGEIRRLTIKNTYTGSLGSLAIKGWLFVQFLLWPTYFQGQIGESGALIATLGWCIYLSAAAWEAGQVRGCKKVLEALNLRLHEDHHEISVSFEQAAKLPAGIFGTFAYIRVTDECPPDKNEPKFTLGPFQLRESTKSS